MKYIKLLLISIIAFFVLFTLIGLLFPSNIKAVRAVVIDKKQQDVYAALNKTTEWVKWYPYFSPDAGAAITPAPGGWVFTNDQKDLQVTAWKTGANELSFHISAWNGMEVNEQVLVLPISGDSTQTQVVWNETEHLKWYPWERFRGLLLERTKGVYLDSALYRFKAYVETTK